MTENPIKFPSGELTLEGLLVNPGSDAPAAIVCHPHPMYGGSMLNNVVDAILAAMWKSGYATLRFNFRGVGASEGEHDGGPGEVDDARAAIAFLLAQPGVRREDSVIAGYSFGAMVAVGAGYESADIARIVAVALPLAITDVKVPVSASKPLLLVSGDRDSYSPRAGLEALQKKIGKSARLDIVSDADHFFAGRETDLTSTIATALAG